MTCYLCHNQTTTWHVVNISFSFILNFGRLLTTKFSKLHSRIGIPNLTKEYKMANHTDARYFFC